MGLKEYIFGFDSEELAAKFLIKNKYEILHRNFHSRYGEIDIIASKDKILHFIEVKSSMKGYEVEYRITNDKIYKIIKTINFFLLKYQLDLDYQIDLICIKNGGEIDFMQNIGF